MSAVVLPLHGDQALSAAQALARFSDHLDRCKLSPHTLRAYRRQGSAFVAWLGANPGLHPDAFADVIGAESAVTGWKRDLLKAGAAASSVNQGLAAATLLFEVSCRLRIKVKKVAVPPPGAPDALGRNEEAALRRAADRAGVRDAAIIFLMLDTGARLEETARLELDDLRVSERKGHVRLLGKGDEVRQNPVPAPARQRLRDWLIERESKLPGEVDHGQLWVGIRGPINDRGITDVVLRTAKRAGLVGVTPHKLRHTFATRLRQAGVDIAVIQRLMGHASLETTARYFRASQEEVDAAVEDVFG